MDSFFDEVDDELLQIFSLISSPVTAAPYFQPPLSPPNATSDPTPEQIFSQVSSPGTAAPFFQPPLSPPNATSDPTPEQIFSQVSSPGTAAPFFQPPLSPPNATSDPTPEQIFSQVSSPVTAAPFFQPPLSPPNATSDPTPEQIFSLVSSPVTAVPAPFFHPPLSPPNATSDPTPAQIFSQVSSPVTAAPFFQPPLSPLNATSDPTREQIFSLVSSPVTAVPAPFFVPPLSPSFQPPSSLPGSNFDPTPDQIFSFVSSPVTAVPFFEPPSSPPGRTSYQTPIAVDKPQRKRPATKNPNEKENRKIIHRDVERQRRQEMSNLYSSIRSLLPQKHLKGKRSVSDHLNEAVNYIKYMQTKMRELNDKRDALKRLSKSSTISTEGQSSTQKQDLVMVRPSWTGGRIVLYTAIANNCLSLSTLIRVLEDDGVHIISYFFFIVNHRSIYTMECEVNGKGDRDWSELQMRLTNLAHLSMNEMSSAVV